MRVTLFVFALLAGLVDTAFAGDIFKCVGSDGAVMFTNIACPADNTVVHVSSYTPVPDAPNPAYSKPSFAPAKPQPSAQAAYQAGYAQAQADAQDEPSRDEPAYAAGWVPFYPVRRAQGRNHHHHPPKMMAVQASARLQPMAIRPGR